MTLKEIFSPTFKDLLRHPDMIHPSATVRSCRSDDSDLCKEVVAKGLLTKAQIVHAAERYYLGKSRSGKCIYWMIDRYGKTLEGHIGDAWVSKMLKARDPEGYYYHHFKMCFFGEHLLGIEGAAGAAQGALPAVALIESERSAVILSELFPQLTWLAWVEISNLTIDRFERLKGRQVILYPRASDTMEDYMYCYNVADLARQDYQLDITVSPILEDHTTPDQKARGIDLLNFILES